MKKMSASTAKKINQDLIPLKTEVPDLNNGGCGVFACYFTEKMISLGYDAKIIELHGDSLADILFGGGDCGNKNPTENKKNMHLAATKNISPDTCNVKIDSHYVVKIDDFYFDSENLSETGGGIVVCWGCEMDIIGEVPLKDFEYVSLVNRGDVWNDDYSPRKNDTVKKIIDSSLAFLS